MNSGLHGFVIYSTMTISTRKYAHINDSTYPGVSLHAHTPVGLAGGSVFFRCWIALLTFFIHFIYVMPMDYCLCIDSIAAWDIPIDYIFFIGMMDFTCWYGPTLYQNHIANVGDLLMFHALWSIAFMFFHGVDWPLAHCMLVHFKKNCSERQMICTFDMV